MRRLSSLLRVPVFGAIVRSVTLLSVTLLGAPLITPVAAQTRVLTADDYARAERFLGFATAPLVSRIGVQPTWLPDGRFWYRVRQPDGSTPMIVVDPATGAKTDCSKSAPACAATVPPGVSGRRSGPPETLSPDGTKAAFVRDWNLWVRDVASNTERQVTTDGTTDFGYATDNAGWIHSDRAILTWSDDSKKIATFQQDQRGVGEMYLTRTRVGRPELSAWKYPLPGDSVVSMIHRVVIDLSGATPKTVRLKMPADQHRSSVCDHISCVDGEFADVQWYPDGSALAFVSSSRDHKVATLRVANATTGDVRDVLREEVPTQFESGDNVPNWRVLPASNEVLWFSERDDWGHLYLYDLTTGTLKSQVTSGVGNVVSVARIDAASRTLWFVGVGQDTTRDPYFKHLYRIGLDGRRLTLLTPEDGDHTTWLSPNGKVFVDSWSRPDLPPTAVLRNATTGKLIATLEQADISRLIATGWKPPARITVKARDGKTDLYGLMFTPTSLDSTKQYPIINYIYPGPQVGSVGSRAFSASPRDHQALAELGFVVVAIDGMGTPLRSKSFHDAYYGRMGDNTLPDQVAGDAATGRSVTGSSISTGRASGVTQAVVSPRPAPCSAIPTSSRSASPSRATTTIATTRTTGASGIRACWCAARHGVDNYEAEANQSLAKNLKGKLLLAHGTLDDNVPPDNTLLVVDALIKAGKDFDLLMIPNAAHGYGAASNYMMRRRWDYFVTHLLGATPPKEYQIGPKDPRP